MSELTQAEREEILFAAFDEADVDWDDVFRAVERILTARSADMEARIRAAQAEAWSQGYGDGIRDEATSQDWTNGHVPPARANPYRALLDAAPAGGAE